MEYETAPKSSIDNFIKDVKLGMIVSENEESKDGWAEIRSPSPFVKMERRVSKKSDSSTGVARATVTIDASPADVISWHFNYASRERVELSQVEGNPARIIVERTAMNDHIYATIKGFPFPLSNREFVMRQVWRVESRDVVSLYCKSVPLEVDYGGGRVKEGITRATTRFVLRAERIDSRGTVPQCCATLTQYIDPRGLIPKVLVNSKVSRGIEVQR